MTAVASSLTLKAQTDWRLEVAPHGRYINDAEIIDGNTMILVGGNKNSDSLQAVFKSIDSGNTFDIILDVWGEWLQSVDFMNSQAGVAVGHNAVVIKTTNTGSLWDTITLQGNAALRDYNAVFFTDTVTGYMAGGSSNLSKRTILKTTDQGESWTTVKDDEGSILKTLYFINNDTGYAGGENGTLLRTDNGGVNWTPLTLPNQVSQRTYNSIHFTSTTTGIAVGGKQQLNDSIQTIIRTTDGGDTWTIIKDEVAPCLKDVHFANPGFGYAVGEWAVALFSSDTGLTWTAAEIPDTINNERFNNTVEFLHPYFGVIAGNIGKVMIYQPPAPPIPVLALMQPTNMNGFQAILNGTINPNTTDMGYGSTVQFEYGTSVSVLNHITLEPFPFTGTEVQPLGTLLNNLQPNTTYYYRLKATSLLGEFYTPIASFNTNLNAIPNWDFEEWDTLQFHHPDEWNFIPNIEQVSSFDGGYAVKITTKILSNRIGPGALVQFLPSDQTFNGGIPFTSRPDSVKAWLNYNITPGDSALFAVVFKKNYQTISNHFFRIRGTTNNTFIQHSFPITFQTPDNPDTLMIGITNCDPFGEDDADTSSWMIIDKISFTGTTENVPNSDFENWSYLSIEDLTGWYGELKQDRIMGPGVPYRKTTDSYSGNYAFEYTPNFIDDEIRMSAGVEPDSSGRPAFPLFHQPFTLNGFFKYFPENNDSLTINITTFNNGTTIGTGRFACDSMVADYTPFVIPIQYNLSQLVPDSGFLEILPTADTVNGISRFFIDALSFDGFANADTVIIDAIETAEGQLNPVSIKAYPNPANEFMNIELWNTEKGSFISILNMNGQTLFSQQLHETQSGTCEKIRLELNDYKSGIYIINYSGRQTAVSGKFIVK